ncbi:MAG: hypothetical protein M1828_003427 [Chrysothrix sp. TS-e1954]|nr:MAG: hypothetical protein M1828_003427 [Chrysothrix sp. TS-e1954]
MAGSVAAFVRFEGESSSDWRPPASWQHVSPAQSSLELDSLRIAKIFEKDVLQRPTPARVPSTLSKAPLSSAPANNGGEVNATPNELEMSRPPSPTALEMSELKQSWKRPQMNRWRVLTACLINFAGGCSDSAPGALLPYIEQYYHVNYAIVSMIFITNAVGFIAASGIVQLLDSKLGRAKTLMLSEIIVAIGYVMMIIPPPYAVFALGYFFTGLGMATTLALNNVFCANLSNATVILGFLHGSYGLGGVLSPIIATTMVTHGILFSRFYSALLGLRVINFCMVTYSFRHFERDLGLDNNARLIQRTASGRQIPTSKTVRFNEYFKALKNRTTLIGALFIFAYQGAEVSISGWVISFLITVRQGDPAHVGYVTAGFWVSPVSFKSSHARSLTHD